ncbi:MAG: trans-sulfuration enzyme family protein [Spirochaetota bacterium]
MSESKYLETEVIHGGEPVPGDDRKGLAPPIHMSTTFTFDSLEQAEQVMDFSSSDYVYTRGNNPTLRLFEQRMAVLEGGKAAVAFSSGMAAISSVLLALVKPGDSVLIHKTLYGSSYTLATKLLPRYGVQTIVCNLLDSEATHEAIRENRPSVIYFETPSNPDLSIIDIQSVTSLARQYEAAVVVDNTFATPFLQNPLQLGADIVVHSATKYICGHGDALGGVAVFTDSKLAHRVKFDYMCELGGAMSPFNGWLMLRGLKTLHLRMERHCENALRTAEFLQNRKDVSSVRYPGLPDHPQHELAGRQMRAFGGVVSFIPTGGAPAARKCLDNFSLAKIAVSLGDCETLVQLPAAMTHRGYKRSELESFGLSEDLIRISVGIEHIDSILADLDHALTAKSG